MAEEKIQFTKLLECCLDFKKNPTPENEAAIKAITDRFVIREYLPLIKKTIQASCIVNLVRGDELDAIEAELWLTMGKVVYGVMAYVDNLENDLHSLAITAAAVDLLYELGIVDSVLSHCGKDFNRLNQMVDETINFSNIFRIVDTASMFSSESINAFITELQKFKGELTPEMLKNLKDIAKMQSPELQALHETFKEEALEKAMEKDLEQKPTEEKKEDNKA